MSDRNIASLFRFQDRFLRSVYLERDFSDPAAMAGYVFTDHAQACFDRVVEGIRPQSTRRAWRITGDYGTGKSSFALLLARSFAGQNGFPRETRERIDFRQFKLSCPQYIPVLCTCSRQSLAISLLNGLYQALCRAYSRGRKPGIINDIQALIRDKSVADDQVISIFQEAAAQVLKDSKGKGLLIILDELGKFLEHAATNPDATDVFLLQNLGECAARSGNKPIFVVCVLHQGFSSYADALSLPLQREWEKIAGRFEEIVFDQPVEQIALLTASALNVREKLIPRSTASSLRAIMQRSLDLKWFGGASPASMMKMADKIFPIHPMALPALIRIFKRFGQNERSLFGFLLSSEPLGVREFSEKQLRGARLYCLHNLYDYVRSNFGHRLSTLSYRSHWNWIDSIIESFAGENNLHINILKTVGILNLLNDVDLPPTEEVIILALSDGAGVSAKNIHDAIEELQKNKRVLYNRGRAKGLCLWPHTSIDIENTYAEAKRSVSAIHRVTDVISGYVELRPLVARKHYIETGNLRYYTIKHVAASRLVNYAEQDSGDADGAIIIPLCETQVERRHALSSAQEACWKSKKNILIGVPKPLQNLSSLVQEVRYWEWIIQNTAELNDDKYAAEEVSRQSEAARAQLEQRLKSALGFTPSDTDMQMVWFWQGKKLPINNLRQLHSWLSKVFDSVYNKAPRVNNELINRRRLSSAAAAARMRLIERMFSDEKTENLAMNSDKRPPEMSMYLSVLLNPGIHHMSEGAWRIAEPKKRLDAECRMLPTFEKMLEVVRQQPDVRLGVAQLFEELRKPPFGVRDGLIPLLFTVFTISHEKDVALYKNGTFIHELTSQVMLELIKTPECFEIQYCKIAGIRAEIFMKLMDVLEVRSGEARKGKLLTVVKPLCVFVAHLPAYVHSTKKLSATAIGVRDTILNAHEPAKLLFSDLPKACGLEQFLPTSTNGRSAKTYIKALKTALDELRAAYPELQERLRRALREAFALPGSFQQFRSALAGRAEQVVVGVNEPKLRAFCLRLMDENLPEIEWVESLGSFLALKPPAKWTDTEEGVFSQELIQTAERFHRVESIIFANGRPLNNGVGVRLAVTRADGTERQQVIHYSRDEEKKLIELQAQFEALLEDGRLGLAAASKAIWANLDKGEKRNHG